MSAWYYTFACILLFFGLGNLAAILLRYRLKVAHTGSFAINQIKYIREHALFLGHSTSLTIVTLFDSLLRNLLCRLESAGLRCHLLSLDRISDVLGRHRKDSRGVKLLQGSAIDHAKVQGNLADELAHSRE
jgi:hypothetical protein